MVPFLFIEICSHP
jgi:hypothetical protein